MQNKFLKPKERFEKEVQTDQGNWFLKRINPFYNDDGLVDGVVVSFVDINTLKQVEQFNQKILKSSLNGIYIYDRLQQKNLYINPQYTKLTGYTFEQLNEMSSRGIGRFDPSRRSPPP